MALTEAEKARRQRVLVEAREAEERRVAEERERLARHPLAVYGGLVKKPLAPLVDPKAVSPATGAMAASLGHNLAIATAQVLDEPEDFESALDRELREKVSR